MPNHVTNRLTVIKGDYDLDTIKSFNDTIPLPDLLKDTEHGIASTYVEYLLGVGGKCLGDKNTLDDLYKEFDEETVNKLIKNQLDYGHTTWYGWRTNNWGTKWDMYDRDYKEEVLTFDTAWRAPIEYYKALAKVLPEDVIIKVEYASEDLGQHSGVCYLHRHDFSNEEYSQGSFEAYDLAVELKSMQDAVKYIDGEWVWLDEIYEDDCDE